jgi:hypothetical protein
MLDAYHWVEDVLDRVRVREIEERGRTYKSEALRDTIKVVLELQKLAKKKLKETEEMENG